MYHGPDAARGTVRPPGDVRRPAEGARHPGRRDRGRGASCLAQAGAAARPRRGGRWRLARPTVRPRPRRPGRLVDPLRARTPSRPNVLVPDWAGWRRSRMPRLPDTAYFPLAPDWICEIISPSTASLDRVKKLAIYAREGVAHAWLVDPIARTLEVLRLETRPVDDPRDARRERDRARRAVRRHRHRAGVALGGRLAARPYRSGASRSWRRDSADGPDALGQRIGSRRPREPRRASRASSPRAPVASTASPPARVVRLNSKPSRARPRTTSRSSSAPACVAQK